MEISWRDTLCDVSYLASCMRIVCHRLDFEADKLMRNGDSYLVFPTFCSCPFCAGDVHGYEALESREAFARMRALEDEREGLRTQLERFSSRVSDGSYLRTRLLGTLSPVTAIIAAYATLEMYCRCGKHTVHVAPYR